jgi:chaperonin GroEL (HSP60 family)
MSISQPTSKEGVLERNAIMGNIMAVRVVAEALKTTLGPKGMDKMLLTETKEVAITDRGAAILSLIKIKHPAARMLVEAAMAQDAEAGDGTTSVVVLAGELLKKAEELLHLGLHPAIVREGYRIALGEVLKHLEEVSIPLDGNTLLSLATTILQGKVGEKEARYLADIAVGAVKIGGEKDNVMVLHRPGGGITDTQLVRGMVIDLGKRVHPSMPRRVENARILLVDTEFVVHDVDKAKVEVLDPARLRAFREYKSRVLKVAVNMIKASGANVVLCQKNIEDLAMFFLAQEGILGVRDVDKKVLELLSKATGGRIISNVRDIDSGALGYAAHVEEGKIGIEEIMYITGCRNPKAAAILVRGGSENTALEIRKRIESLISALSKVLMDGRCLPGGGACEVELARRLRNVAPRVKGKPQLAVLAFAEALEVIPWALAVNAGMDPLTFLPLLRAKHEEGGISYGLDLMDRKVKDVRESGIFESLAAKRQALTSAGEVTEMILKIDEVLMARGGEEEKLASMPIPQPREEPDAMDFPAREGKIDFRQLMG